jgi:hypothetical protein
MESKILLVEALEDKSTKTGKAYTRFKTSEGWMSCFDFNTIKELKKLIGQNVNLQLTQSGEFHNITGVNGVAQVSQTAGEVKAEPRSVVPNNSRITPMFVSYAKDIFCEFVKVKAPNDATQMTQLMEECIAIVNQARTAFE